MSSDPLDGAEALAREVLAFVRQGDLTGASVQLTLFQGRMLGAHTPNFSQGLAAVLDEISLATGGGKRGRSDIALRVDVFSALKQGLGPESWVELLKRAEDDVRDGPDHFVDEIGFDFAELQLGVLLGRVRRLHEAVQVLDGLLARLRTRAGADGLERDWIEFQAGYAASCYEWEQERWVEAIAAADRFVGRWLPAAVTLTVAQRARLAYVMWIRCGSLLNVSLAHDPVPSAEAYSSLDELLAWLRTQPEAPLRFALAERLVTKVQWYAPSDTSIDALEEFVDVLERLDPDEVPDLADSVLSETLWLASSATPEDAELNVRSRFRALKRGRLPPAPEVVGISAATANRQERLLAALQRLARQLADDPDPRSVELRAEVLVGSVSALAMLGRNDEAEAVFDQLAEIGEPALGACESLIARHKQRGKTRGLDIAARYMKAALLVQTGQDDAGRKALASFVKDFADSEIPMYALLAKQARKVLKDL